MDRRTYFPLAKTIVQMSALLGVDPIRIIRRAMLPRDFLSNEGKGGTSEQALAVWAAIETECNRLDLALFLAKAFAHAPFTPSMFAFSSSPNVTMGLRRLAVFKPLMGPIRLTVSRDDKGLLVEFSCIDPSLVISPKMAMFETFFILEAARSYTAAAIEPLEVGLPSPEALRREDVDFIGSRPRASVRPYLRLSAKDADLPLITENAEAWPDFETRMRAKLAELDNETSMTLRVKTVLLDMLPSGEATIEALCQRLHMSKRSAQRHLRAEGESFKSVLTAIRSELAMSYLAKGDLSVEEISYLLAYREPNSFYRAFQSWTQMTPAEARGLALQ